MDDAVKVILKKLDDIDSRLQTLEGGKITVTEKKAEAKTPIAERDPLFGEAVKIMDKFDEISVITMAEALEMDVTRATKILDQLEAAGFGTCYFKEA